MPQIQITPKSSPLYTVFCSALNTIRSVDFCKHCVHMNWEHTNSSSGEARLTPRCTWYRQWPYCMNWTTNGFSMRTLLSYWTPGKMRRTYTPNMPNWWPPSSHEHKVLPDPGTSVKIHYTLKQLKLQSPEGHHKWHPFPSWGFNSQEDWFKNLPISSQLTKVSWVKQGKQKRSR